MALDLVMGSQTLYQKHEKQKKRVYKLGSIKTKNLHAKDVIKVKWQLIEWEQRFANHISV